MPGAFCRYLCWWRSLGRGECRIVPLSAGVSIVSRVLLIGGLDVSTYPQCNESNNLQDIKRANKSEKMIHENTDVSNIGATPAGTRDANRRDTGTGTGPYQNSYALPEKNTADYFPRSISPTPPHRPHHSCPQPQDSQSETPSPDSAAH